MPADGYIATPELRFVPRTIPGGGSQTITRLRILQQRWVMVGTYWHEHLTDKNSEWRDVPLAEEVPTASVTPAEWQREHEQKPVDEDERRAPAPHPGGVQF